MYALVQNTIVVASASTFQELRPDLSFKVGVTDDELKVNFGIYSVVGPSYNAQKQKLTSADPYFSTDTVYDATAQDLTLPEVQANVVDAIGVQYSGKTPAGFNYQGHNFQIDAEAQKNMIAVRVQLLTGAQNPHGGYWRTSDNQMVAMNDMAVVTFINAAYTYGVQCLQQKWTLEAEVVAASTVDLVLAIDVTAGWPSN